MARSPLALGLAQGRSKPLNAARLVNLYAEPTPEGSISKWVLYGTPGMKLWGTFTGGPIRAGHFRTDHVIILAGQKVYSVDVNGAQTLLTGALVPSEGNVTMVDNGVQLGMLVGRYMFYANGLVLSQVSDTDFPSGGATSIDYIDGYGILSAPTNGQFFLSGLYDFSTYDSLDFATAESIPDPLFRVLAVHKEAWLFGQETIEVWVNTGASPFPFELVTGSLLDRGIGAALSAIKMDNSVFWLGDDRIVYRADGYTPVRVSTFAVEEILRSGDVSDAVAHSYSQAGHTFYVLRLPTLGRTLVLDAATTLWHERQSGTDAEPGPWEITCLFEAFGKTLVGTEAGLVYELDLNTYLDGTSQIRRSVTSLPVYPEGRRAIMRSLELECELGVGKTTGQGSDPKAMLRFSRDGGQTWGNEKTAGLGPKGSRRARAMWENLGMFREGVAELSVADPVRVAIYGARYEAEGLLS